MISKNIKIFLLVFIFASNSNFAQKFGFGCLGLSGFYGGITEQRYEAKGINNFSLSIAKENLLLNQKIEFSKSRGLRFGANFFRAQWDKFFITAKGFYQFQKEEQSTISSTKNSYKFILNMNNYGAAIDIGIPIFSKVDWKIIEGGINFYNAEFILQDYSNNSLSHEYRFSQSKLEPNYYLATGLLIHIIKDYISLEGTIRYHQLKINDLKNESPLPVGPGLISNPIEKNSVSGTVQLNISFPF